MSRTLILAFITACILLPASMYARQQKHHNKRAATTHSTKPTLLLKSQNGNLIQVDKQKGKVVFINFWATTCVPCKVEMPTIDRLRIRFANDTNVLILPVDLDNNLPASTGFMQTNGLGLAVYTAAGPVPSSYFRGVLPTTLVIDKAGNLARLSEGESDYSTSLFAAYIDSLSKQKP